MKSSEHREPPERGRSGDLISAISSLVLQLLATQLRGEPKGPPNTRPRDWMVIFTAASALGALLAAIFSGWAAYENQASVRETNRATRASVWLQVLADFETPDMLSSLNFLRQWQSNTPNFDSRFYELLTNGAAGKDELELSKHIDADRRRVIKFFDKLRILTQGDIIDSYFVSQNWDSGTYTYINEVLAPLHRKKLLAMLDTKALSPEDYANANKVLSDILKFYYDTVVLKRPSPIGEPSNR